MLNRKELRFERRSILTAAQLRTIEKFPREFLRLKFAGYGDGIISGLDFDERGKEIFLTEGLVKIGDTFFFAEETNLSAIAATLTEGKRYRLTLGEPERTASENVISETIALKACAEDVAAGKLEFGTFKAGMLKLPTIDEEDLFAEFTRASRLNLLNVRFSVNGGATFHPHIFRAVLTRLERKENPSAADLALMFQLANSEAVSFQTLKLFAESKGVTWQGDSWEDSFKSLIAAVDATVEIILPERPSPKDERPRRVKSSNSIFIDD